VLLYVVCSLLPCAVCLYHCMGTRFCMSSQCRVLCWLLITFAVDVVRLWKFPIYVYGLVLSLCWLGSVCNGYGGWGGGGV